MNVTLAAIDAIAEVIAKVPEDAREPIQLAVFAVKALDEAGITLTGGDDE